MGNRPWQPPIGLRAWGMVLSRAAVALHSTTGTHGRPTASRRSRGLPYYACLHRHGLGDMCMAMCMHPLESFPPLAVPDAILHPKASESPARRQAPAVPWACRLPHHTTRPPPLCAKLPTGAAHRGPGARFFLARPHHSLSRVERKRDAAKKRQRSPVTHTTSAFAMHVSLRLRLGTAVCS